MCYQAECYWMFGKGSESVPWRELLGIRGLEMLSITHLLMLFSNAKYIGRWLDT